MTAAGAARSTMAAAAARSTMAAAAALVMCLASACATSGADSPGGGSAWPTGRTFISTEVTEKGAPRPLIGDSKIELSFAEEGRLGARAGCNHLGGDAAISAGRLVVGNLSMTEMGCPDGLNAQDSWLAGVLTAKPTLALDGDVLTLVGPDVTIRLTDRRVVNPDRPLAGTRWVVDTILNKETASSVPAGAEAVLQLAAAGTFEATTGCAGGRLAGSAGIQSGRVSFLDVQATPCTGDANALDAAVRKVLLGEVTYTVTANRLTLTASDGNGLGLVAA